MRELIIEEIGAQKMLILRERMPLQAQARVRQKVLENYRNLLSDSLRRVM